MSGQDGFFHGGVPGLRKGDLLQGGHERRIHDGCPYCAARSDKAGNIISPNVTSSMIDPPSAQPHRVYVTTDRGYARHYASLWGRGDLYRVELLGAVELSEEDSFETYIADGARITSVLERAVLLTNSQRRVLYQRWGAADLARDQRQAVTA